MDDDLHYTKNAILSRCFIIYIIITWHSLQMVDDFYYPLHDILSRWLNIYMILYVTFSSLSRWLMPVASPEGTMMDRSMMSSAWLSQCRPLPPAGGPSAQGRAPSAPPGTCTSLVSPYPVWVSFIYSLLGVDVSPHFFNWTFIQGYSH